jgi:hypothetical protein
LDEGKGPHQLSLRGDEEIHAPKTHVHVWDPASAVASHPWPTEDDETHKRPLLGVPTVDVSNHRLVNLYLHVWPR